MAIKKHLEISTGNMKSTDNALLSKYLSSPLTGRKRPEGGVLTVDPIGEYGYTISLGGWSDHTQVDALEQQALEEGFSPEFVAILRHGVDNLLEFVQFDANVDPEPGFPVFDWENGDAVVEEEDFPPRM